MQDPTLQYSVPAVGPGAILWLFFGLVFIMTAYYVFAQLYHWIRYNYMYPMVWVAAPIYLIGVVVLLGMMITGIGAA